MGRKVKKLGKIIKRVDCRDLGLGIMVIRQPAKRKPKKRSKGNG